MPVGVRIGLIRVRLIRTAVADIAHAIGVRVGLIGIRVGSAVVAGIAHVIESVSA